MKHLVKADHPVLPRPDKFFSKNYDAVCYAWDLKNEGYENVVIKNTHHTTRDIMELLGCLEVRPLIFRHPDIEFDLDFTATSEDKILLRLMHIFSEKGYEGFRDQFREMLGF